MARGRLLTCCPLIVSLIAGTAVRGEVAEAPIYGGVSFTDGKAAHDILFVESDGNLILAEDAAMLQGVPNSRIVASKQLDRGRVYAADVFERDGASLYMCFGPFRAMDAGRRGLVPVADDDAKWESTYNRGHARLILQINGPGVNDDIVAEGSEATVLVRLVGGEDRPYNLTITSKELPPDHKIEEVFPPPGRGRAPLNLNMQVPGPSSATEFRIFGIQRGEFTIEANGNGPDADVKGSTSGRVLSEDDFG